MRVIILVFDEPEEKVEEVKVENDTLKRKILDAVPMLGSRDWYRLRAENQIKKCFCLKNNAIDRSKILIRYLRKYLRFRKNQIQFLRTSRFSDAKSVFKTIKQAVDDYKKEDFLFYLCGHGLTGKPTGMFLGERNQGRQYLFYRSLKKIFQNFQGRLILINDCCWALSIEPYLKSLTGRYLLFGASRKRRVSQFSILDSVLGYWYWRKPALPKVFQISSDGQYIMDYPANCVRGSYYNCGCGKIFNLKKRFESNKMPSLRRGANLDFLFFRPVTV